MQAHDEPVADGGRTVAETRLPTLQQVRTNIARLLTIESETERERTRSREALVHAGKMAAVGRMVASVNHEIKRPLASMQLLLENARNQILRGDTLGALENIALLQRATAQLNELSRQLEAFSRKTPLNLTGVVLREVVAHARSVLSPKIRTGRHTVDVRVGEQRAIADFDRLTLALVNLIDNAMDACADCEDRRIEICAQHDGDTVVLRVRDHGPGIADGVLDRLFEAFFTTKAQGQGLGLGLALSSEVVDEMHGCLAAYNHPDGGAEFCIRLPAVGER